MAISPIGNVVYINQNTQANVPIVQGRADITPLNIQEFEDKIKDIQEVRATEETNTINKDTQKEGGNYPQEQKQKKEEKKEDEVFSNHLLDIKA